jgi:hypothetical protein
MRFAERLALAALIVAVSAVVGVGTLAPMLKQAAPPSSDAVAIAPAPVVSPPVAVPAVTAAPVTAPAVAPPAVAPPQKKAALANLTEPPRPPEPAPAPAPAKAAAFPPPQPLTEVTASEETAPPIVAATEPPTTAQRPPRQKRAATRTKERARIVRPRPFTIEDLFAGRPFPIR